MMWYIGVALEGIWKIMNHESINKADNIWLCGSNSM